MKTVTVCVGVQALIRVGVRVRVRINVRVKFRVQIIATIHEDGAGLRGGQS